MSNYKPKCCQYTLISMKDMQTLIDRGLVSRDGCDNYNFRTGMNDYIDLLSGVMVKDLIHLRRHKFRTLDCIEKCVGRRIYVKGKHCCWNPQLYRIDGDMVKSWCIPCWCVLEWLTMEGIEL